MLEKKIENDPRVSEDHELWRTNDVPIRHPLNEGILGQVFSARNWQQVMVDQRDTYRTLDGRNSLRLVVQPFVKSRETLASKKPSGRLHRMLVGIGVKDR